MSHFVQILIFLPVVGAIIGYTCKWVAIKMLFHPARWIGIGPPSWHLGWQGVVQRRAPKFASGVADTVAKTGVGVDTLLETIDPAKLADLLAPHLQARGPALTRAALEAIKPGVWDSLPQPVRDQLIGQLAPLTRPVVAALVRDLRPLLHELIDVRGLIVEQLSGPNADRLARLFQRVGRRELQVVIWYGAVLGFLIGLLEVGGRAALEKWWLLPLIGAIDGLVNNWFAIQMIFRPLKRTYYLGVFPFQGLFPARQEEIAREYAAMLATEVIGPKDLVAHVVARGGDRLVTAATATLERELAALLGFAAMASGTAPTPEVKARVIAAVTAELTATAPAVIEALDAPLRAQLGIADTLERSLAAMDKAEFERVLRGVFEEDEWILVTLGGVLGGGIGTLQAAIVVAVG